MKHMNGLDLIKSLIAIWAFYPVVAFEAVLHGNSGRLENLLNAEPWIIALIVCFLVSVGYIVVYLAKRKK